MERTRAFLDIKRGANKKMKVKPENIMYEKTPVLAPIPQQGMVIRVMERTLDTTRNRYKMCDNGREFTVEHVGFNITLSYMVETKKLFTTFRKIDFQLNILRWEDVNAK